ncbi:MAG: hypothetical protein SGILL_000869 [Bacillariaceae sp.]
MPTFMVLAFHSLVTTFTTCTSSQNRQSSLFQSTASAPDPCPSLNVAVLGAGPSGLLTAHLLLQQDNTRVTLLEARSDPRKKETEERAYALGIGIRGRSSIRTVDETLWQAVKSRGFESERFQLHIAGLVIPLRSEADSKTGGENVEPSVLMFQTDLCGALVDELERRYDDTDRLKVCFDTAIEACDLETMALALDPFLPQTSKQSLSSTSYDMIVGSDGVNSVVRAAIERSHPGFESTKKLLSGEFKVVRLEEAPPKVDPTSRSAILSETSNKTAVVEELQSAFPQWESLSELMATQLIAQKKTGTASSVVCNTYHYNDKAVLIGDSCHATGGVSGQGVNSALQDCVALADSIQNHRNDLASALLSYSEKQVPEGKALFDLSFGPKPKGLKALVWTFRGAIDALFRGKFGIGRPPLQTRLTTTLSKFSEIRRENDKFYAEAFPSEAEIRQQLVGLHAQAMENAKER